MNISRLLQMVFHVQKPNESKFFSNMDETCGRRMTINKTLLKDVQRVRMERSEGELRLRRFNNVFDNPMIESVS